jgi:hypothetical protein
MYPDQRSSRRAPGDENVPFARVTAFAIGWATGTELVTLSTPTATPGTGWPVVAFTTCPVTVGRMFVRHPQHASSMNVHRVALQPAMATFYASSMPGVAKARHRIEKSKRSPKVTSTVFATKTLFGVKKRAGSHSLDLMVMQCCLRFGGSTRRLPGRGMTG